MVNENNNHANNHANSSKEKDAVDEKTDLFEKIKRLAYWGFLFVGIYIILSNFPIFSSEIIDPKAGLIVIFLIGVLTSLHCIGMCGGFVISYAANTKEKGIAPHLCYNGARILSYTILGAFLGLIGGAIAITDQVRGMLSFAAGVFYFSFGLLLKPEFAGLAMALSSVSVVSNSLLLKRFK